MRSQILFPIFALVGALHASDVPDGAALVRQSLRA